MNQINILIFTIVLLTLSSRAFSQYEENKSSEAVNWTILQLIPNPAFIQETDKDNARLLFALRWEVTPINYSFSANKFISPLQFFKINPVRRFAGSAELFVQNGQPGILNMLHLTGLEFHLESELFYH